MKKILGFILLLMIVGSISKDIEDNMKYHKKTSTVSDTKPKPQEPVPKETTVVTYNVSNPSKTQSRKYIVGKDIEPGIYQLKTYGEWGSITYKHDDGEYLSWGILPIEENPIHEYTWTVKTGGVITVGAGSGGKVGVTLTKISDLN